MRRSIIHLFLSVALVLSSRVQAGKQASKAPESPRVVSLAIEPAALNPQKAHTLVPKAEELTDGASFYAKAAQGLPASPDTKQLVEWRDLHRRHRLWAPGQIAQDRSSAAAWGALISA